MNNGLSMWFDTHCHLDANEFEHDLQKVVGRARDLKIEGMLIPAVDVAHFPSVIKLAHQFASECPKNCYTLGIHPLYVDQANDAAISDLERALEERMMDPRLVGVGEIGLDYFVEGLDLEKQEWFFEEQLKLAKKFELPVILHVRKAQDQILKRLRQFKVQGGIAHAFNGSFIQAQAFLDLNFKLGIGGAMTYPRALQIRRLATELPLSAFVIETDAPDIPPAWLVHEQKRRRNEPFELFEIAKEFASLRKISEGELNQQLWQNVVEVIPRLAFLNSPSR